MFLSKSNDDNDERKRAMKGRNKGGEEEVEKQ